MPLILSQHLPTETSVLPLTHWTWQFSPLPENNDGIRHITLNIMENSLQRSYITMDKDGDGHYDVLSALQKSIRGSDVDASLHYAARLIEAGDLPSLARRLTVIAYEDIGLANPEPRFIL